MQIISNKRIRKKTTFNKTTGAVFLDKTKNVEDNGSDPGEEKHFLMNSDRTSRKQLCDTLCMPKRKVVREDLHVGVHLSYDKYVSLQTEKMKKIL